MSNEITQARRAEIREWNREIDATLAAGEDIGGPKLAALAACTALVLDALEAAERERDELKREAEGYNKALAELDANPEARTAVLFTWLGKEIRVFGPTPKREADFCKVISETLNLAFKEAAEAECEKKKNALRERDIAREDAERLRDALALILAAPAYCSCSPESGCKSAVAREAARAALAATESPASGEAGESEVGRG